MWSHIILEGYCLAPKDGTYLPCKRRTVSSFCLQDNMCPYFGYTDSNEKEAAYWVPLYQVVLDKAKSRITWLWDTISWYCWHKWFFKWEEVEVSKRDNEKAEQQKRNFLEWFSKAKE